MLKKYLLLNLLMALLFSQSTYAALEPIKDIDRRYEYYRAVYTAKEDYTQEQVHSWAVKVLNKRAIEDIKTTRVSYSTSVEKIDILEAYNKKADGRRIDAPKTNYQVNTNSGRNADAPVFSDNATITTVFPEVEVGDTLVFSYKRTVTEPMFPGYFAEANSFSRATAYDDIEIKMIVPASYPGLHQNRGMDEKITRKDNTVTYLWRWKNPDAMRDTRRDYSVWDMETNPGFAFTTFNSYQTIAEAYAARALPKVVISDDVKKLADKIVGKEKERKEQARLLYEWVATNITYAGNCVGVGAVVPHDISFILDNHMGDCKDHATLLQALLTAKDIKSVQALINAGSIFKLPSIPAVNSVNHVINYLPEYNLFVDSTSDSTPFGLLPKSIQGKPVLLVEGYKEGLKTPVAAPGSNSQELLAKMDILPDGSLKGTVHINLKGDPAVDARAGWRNVSKDSEEKWLKDIFSRNGYIGSATMTKDDPRPLLDHYEYSVNFDSKEFLLADSAGAFAIYSPAPSYFSLSSLVVVPQQIEEYEITCGSGSSREEYVYRFPDNFRILDVPESKKIKGSYLSYQASYQLNGNVLTVTRQLDDSTLGPTCSPELMKAQKDVLQMISRSLRSQVVYKPLTKN